MDSKITLDAEASQRALESAIRTQAQIVLESNVIPNATINGSLISGDEKALLMEVTGRPVRDPASLVNKAAQVQVYSDRRYSFPTTITAAPRWGETQALAFERPPVITVIDRRRFVRAKLAPSSIVKLEWRRGGGDHRCVATMLNISPDGLACRVEDPAAAAIEAGDTLRARFSLPGQGSAFYFSVAVSNVTPASGTSTILGMQFEHTPEAVAQIERLRESLRSSRDAEVESEVFV